MIKYHLHKHKFDQIAINQIRNSFFPASVIVMFAKTGPNIIPLLLLEKAVSMHAFFDFYTLLFLSFAVNSFSSYTLYGMILIVLFIKTVLKRETPFNNY